MPVLFSSFILWSRRCGAYQVDGSSGILLVEVPEQVHEPLDIGCWHRLPNDHVALGRPVLPVGLRQHPQRQGLADVLELRRRLRSRWVAVSLDGGLHACLLVGAGIAMTAAHHR